MNKMPLFQMIITIIIILVLLVSCAPLQDMRNFFSDGGALLFLCSSANLEDCFRLEAVKVNTQPILWNFTDLVPKLSIYKIRSLAMICGVKTAVLVYDDYYFSGNMDVYHCQPGQMMEIKNMGYMDLITSSIIITNDTYGDMSDTASMAYTLMHTPVDLTLAMDGFRTAIEENFEADSNVDNITLNETQIYWTNLRTWFNDPYRIDKSYEDHQVIVFHVTMILDPHDPIYDPILGNYEVILEWALTPQVLTQIAEWELTPQVPTQDLSTTEPLDCCLDIRSVMGDHYSLWVENGIGRSDIYSGLMNNMQNISKKIGQSIVDQIYLAGEAQALPFGEYLISNIDSIGWTISDPKPCNPYAVETIDDPCHYYKQIPPMIILNRKTTPGEGNACCHWWTNGIDCPTPQPSATPRSRPTVTPNLLKAENIGGIQSITDVNGLYYYDSLNQKHTFQSVQQLDTWMREGINLDEGEDFLLFRQRIGDKDGLRILIGPTSSISAIRTSLVQKQTTIIPTITQVSPEVARDARINAMTIANKGQNITIDELNMLVTDFNTAVSSETDIELSNAILDLMGKLSQIKLIIQTPAVTLPVAK